MGAAGSDRTTSVSPGAETVKLRILVVDDEKQIRKFLRIGLEGEGYEIVEAAGVEDALSVTVKQRPDLVLLDLNLGPDHGLDFLRQVREFSATPVLVLTVRDTEAEKIELLDAGADDYLTKPFGMG